MVPAPRLRLVLAGVLTGGILLASGRAWGVEWLEALPMIGKAEAAMPTEPAAAPQGPRSSKQAVVRVLDKQTNRVQQVTLAAGQPQTLGLLTLNVQTCLFDYKRTPRLDVAWLDIVDETMPDRTFSGWMYSLYPAAATLEHPRYDVRLMSCVLPDGVGRMVPTTNVSLTTPVATDTAGSGDDEAPAAETPQPAPAEPAAVPVPAEGADASQPAAEEPVAEESPAVDPAVNPAADPVTDSATPAVVRPAGQDDPYFVPGFEGDAAASSGEAEAQPQEDAPAPAEAGINQAVDRHALQRMMDGR